MGGLRVAFGPLGLPKASAMPFGRTFLGAILEQKSEKLHSKRHTKIYTKKYRNICQKASEIMPKWRDESVIAHAPEKKVKNEKLLVFPIENVVRAMQKGFKIY